MKTVFKYAIPFSFSEISIFLPKNAKILKIDEQYNSLKERDVLYIWALIDKNETKYEERIFRIFGTGHLIEDDLELEYINTLFTENDSLVWHIFEIKN